MDTKNSGKFAEPRGWALKWVFTEAFPPLTEQSLKQRPGTREKFLEPRSWAAKWDGGALCSEKPNADAPSPDSTSS